MYRSLASKQKSLALLLLAFGIYGPVVHGNGLSFSTATDFTTGKYGGTTSTDIWYVPFTARYDKDRASFRLIVPYLSITGPGNVLGPGIGGIVDGGGPIIGGSVGGSSSGGGGVIVVCDEDTQNCSGENPGREEIDSGSGSGGGNNSGSGGNGGNDDDDNSGSGGGGGNDGDDNSGSNGGDDDDNSGNGGGGDDDNSGSGGSGGDDNGNSGSGGGSDDDDSDDEINNVRLSKAIASGLVGGIPLGGSSLNSTTQSGLGDIVAAFSYNLIDHARTGIAFDITTRLKIPTASAKQNMGSGQVDYAIQGDLFKTISKLTLSATLGYRILGNPSGITFHNVLYGAAGVGYQLSPTVTMGTSYTMGQSPVRLEDSRDLMLYISQRVTNNFRLNAYGIRGFSDRSPDWGGGINLRYIF
ncbi:hypothetical protein SAMN06296273_2240 [Nitrosomonas ureae]|uniref:Uncharacterized protein n=1 Tax=Nitrosomonas ureae TaxID=44577 RepID=A0A285BZN1_9PROT|nr:hypothetical protein [Nitrosomonas ureae]SNX60771.1 hypothetical protein SAMN06296273_2240 [Nitrosomonas ureae]